MKTITIRFSDDMHYKLKELVLQRSREKKGKGKNGKETLQNLVIDQLHKLVPDAELLEEEQEE